jgi:hypothetical protein
MKRTVNTQVVVLALVGLGACTRPVQQKTPPENSATTTPPVWQVTSKTNDLTGVVSTTAVAESRRRGHFGVQFVAVRLTGHELECFVNTGEFLPSGSNDWSAVGYKFDNGPVGRRFMGVSTNHQSLFYMGDVGGFIKKMARAHTLTIEFEPYESRPETATFDVSSFPIDKFEIPPPTQLQAKLDGVYEIRPESDHPRPRIKQAPPRPRIKQAPKVFVPPPTE